MRRLLLLVLLASAAAAQPPDGLAGRWSGAAIYDGTTPRLFDLEFAVDGDRLETVLTMTYNGHERFGYDFTFAAEGPLDGVLTSGLFGEMRLLVDLDEGTLRGTVTADDGAASPVFLQRILDYDLPTYTLAEVSFVAGADTLAGALILPDAPPPYPAAVIVPGRGFGQTRGAGAAWGTMLARNGIAALVFDARGTGASTGDDSLTTGAQRVEDLSAALDLLRARPEVRPDAVGVLSNSAGGWVTPLALAGRDDVAFWVSLVGPAESLADQQGHTTTGLMRRSDQTFSEADYQAAFDFQSALVRLAWRDAPWTEMELLVAEARDQPWAEFALLPEGPDDADLRYYRLHAAYETDVALARITAPTYAVYASDDVIVEPSENIPKLRAAFAEAGNEDLTVVLLEGANHSLGRTGAVVGEGDWPQRWTRLWTRPPELYTGVVAWVRETVGLAD